MLVAAAAGRAPCSPRIPAPAATRPPWHPLLCACGPQVWVARDAEWLRQAGAEGGALPHSFHFQSGALGSGLLLLSRYPIAEVGQL